MRVRILFGLFCLAWAILAARLFYWQVGTSEKLFAAAKYQQETREETSSPRGTIFSSDNFPMVLSKQDYLAFIEPQQIKDLDSFWGKIERFVSLDKEKLLPILNDKKIQWYPLVKGISEETKNKIEEEKIPGVGFEPQWKRFYSEASMAAHLLGFVGSEENGKEKGYFGLEGFYDQELRGTEGLKFSEKDIFGRKIIIGQEWEKKSKSGRDLFLSLDRAVQYLVEQELKSGLEKYQAISGLAVVLDPYTGNVLATASFPSYDPNDFARENSEVFSNPVISSTFEPGSVIKPIVMAAAIDSGLVTQNTVCDICNGPVKIGEYIIRTWNEKYFPQSTMTEVIQHSDNVGMVFVTRKLGVSNLLDYFNKFGFDTKTGIDLEGEVKPNLKEKGSWSEIDLATASFGQGIAVTPIQIIRAIAAIANGGKLIGPSVVERMNDDGKEIIFKKNEGQPIIKPITARVVTQMMINAVEKGEAKWAKPKGYKIAGKTGTAQIPVAGHYDEEKTIASFVGFAPADKPRFVMLVALREPKTSPWGSETAAPLWFSIAKGIFRLWGIAPS